MTRPTPRERRLAAFREAGPPPPSEALISAVSPFARGIAAWVDGPHEGHPFYLAQIAGDGEHVHLLRWASTAGPLARVAEGLGLKPPRPFGRPSVLVIAGSECAWMTVAQLDAAAPARDFSGDGRRDVRLMRAAAPFYDEIAAGRKRHRTRHVLVHVTPEGADAYFARGGRIDYCDLAGPILVAKARELGFDGDEDGHFGHVLVAAAGECMWLCLDELVPWGRWVRDAVALVPLERRRFRSSEFLRRPRPPAGRAVSP